LGSFVWFSFGFAGLGGGLDEWVIEFVDGSVLDLKPW
jgi:hypothetical protein